ncbi:XRE family transcriptional regulator [Caproiciproducens sp. NJN-50]|uniref:helix-turn-helix domain-containing protein n=1 Tax=Acutalibacteraceae TaxID=3082771 RepID=UPI000FFE1885|nr:MULTISPECIES: helix-turn-helix transcriptional regulator [Acutalibacteraceae]QAT48449.1 XRE family transcriptional regulator [Caproiciproducens sp. NJN-50]
MGEIVTIYRINCFSAPEPEWEGESCSLLPWGDPPGLRGQDDGGREYVLPERYAEGIAPGGSPAVFSEEGVLCELMLHNGRPLLIDGEKRRAWLLEPVRKIASYRQMSGMTLSELAERISVEPKLLYEWENLEREPDEEALSRIASILGCKPSDLR